MSQPVATVVAAVILAITFLIVFRWDVVKHSDSASLKLDRWTGITYQCYSNGFCKYYKESAI
jgi:hypothetical protein